MIIFTKYIRLISLIIIIMPLTGCFNKYYLLKKLDVFKPKINDKFTVYHNTSIDYYESIFNKLVSELSKIPMEYSSSPYVPYSVYFDNNKRFFLFPVFKVIIIKQNNTFSTPDEIVYESLVYSYNPIMHKSLIASLKIIGTDIVENKYTKSKYIKVTKKDIEDILKEKVKKIDLNKGGDIEHYKSDKKEYLKYKLYNNAELYKK